MTPIAPSLPDPPVEYVTEIPCQTTKALLIGVVYWRRAEILGRPVHIGAGSWACLIAVVTIGVAIALTVCVAARHQNDARTP